MRVAFVTSQVITAHATMKRALGMAPVLADRNHEVHVLLERHPDNESAFGTDGRVRRHFFDPGSSRFERLAKTQLLGRIDPDVTHICGLGWRNSLRRSGVTGAWLMDHVELESSILGSSLIRRMRQWVLERWSIGAHDGIVAASRYLEQWALRRGKPRERVLYLPYAHDARANQMVRTSNWRERYSGRRIVLYSGGWWTNYGFHDMLEAGRELLKRRKDFVMVLTGRGPEEHRGSRWIRENALGGHIILAGYLPAAELEELMAASDVFLSPLSDTVQDKARCPSKMFLYMQHGRPIVTATVGEGLEYFSDSRFHYQPGDIVAMAGAIDRALKEGRSWSPNYDPALHTWHRRVEQWEQWVGEKWRTGNSGDSN